MILVACSGFPVPVSRYWGQFPAVEVSDTEIGMPGEGTVRRWLREAPKGFGFTLLAPGEIGRSGFQRSDENKAHVEAVGKLAERLGALGVVFVAPEGYDSHRTRKAAVKTFVEWLPKKFPQVILDLPDWKPEHVVGVTAKRPIIAAYDPLHHDPPPTKDLAYVRLPGPAGKRSRYDEAAIDKIAEHCESLDVPTVFCVFRNIDMHPNARALLDKLGS